MLIRSRGEILLEELLPPTAPQPKVSAGNSPVVAPMPPSAAGVFTRNRETGKSQASTFAENGVVLFRADNNRQQGWYALKELLKIRADGKPGIILFDTCNKLIDCLKCIQHDKTNPHDVAKHPHELTHGPDALRYFAQTYVLPAEQEVQQAEEEDDDIVMDYATYMCGTGESRSYICS